MNFKDLISGETGVVGTNYEIRKQVMKPIIEANPESLKIVIDGLELTLLANWSVSRKSVVYSVGLTLEQYIHITGSDFGYSRKKESASLSINQEGHVEIFGGGNYYAKISNKNITIL